PGPMHVNLPEDVLAGDPEADGPSGSPGRTPAPPAPDGATVAAVAEHLVDADRPVLLCGEGAVRAGAFEPVRRLARAADAPVVTSMNGKGVVDETADYAAGVAGRWGYCEVANGLLADADLVVGLGCRFGDLTTVGGSQPSAGATVVHVDLDPHWLGRTVDVDVPVLADVRATADRLASALEERPVGPGDRLEAVADRYATWRSSFASLLESDASPIAPHRIVDELHRATPPSAILVSSTSFPGFFTAAFYQVREPGARYLQARGSDGINCALPQAIGAQLANPDVPVVAVTGDGGLGYHVADLETAARVGAPITVIVFDNQSLGSSKASMLANQGVALSTDFHPEVDYATVAEGFGCTGIAVDEPEAFAAALADAVGADEPTLIDAHIDPNAIPPVLV
ncbi:MAG: thiamine pyrophosphate-binding protein, partial [Halobacteriota archaeon]